MQEHEPVAGQLLQDEAFTAEETGADALGECNRDIHAASATKEGVLLRDDRAAPFREVDRLDLPGERRREGHVPAHGRIVHEDGDEEGIAGEDALPGLEQAIHQLVSAASRHIEGRHHPDAVLHVHHGAGLGHDSLFRVEGHDDALQVVADELVVDFVGRHGEIRVEVWPEPP